MKTMRYKYLMKHGLALCFLEGQKRRVVNNCWLFRYQYIPKSWFIWLIYGKEKRLYKNLPKIHT